MSKYIGSPSDRPSYSFSQLLPRNPLWTQRTTGTTRWLNDVAFVDNTWFVVGNQGTLLTSSNLATWSPQPIATGKSLYGVATTGGQLVAAGIEGIILRSWPVPPTNGIAIAQFSFGYSTNITAARPWPIAARLRYRRDPHAAVVDEEGNGTSFADREEIERRTAVCSAARGLWKCQHENLRADTIVGQGRRMG